MLMIIIFLFFGLIEHVSSIQCYACRARGNYCPTIPLNFDDGDESNENEIEIVRYDPDHVCMCDHSIDVRNGKEKIILRGIKSSECTDINIPNRRVYCCNSDFCNKQLQPMIVRSLSDSIGRNIESSNQRLISSIILIMFMIIFQCFFK